MFYNCPKRCDCIQFIILLLTVLHVSGVDTHHQKLVQLYRERIHYIRNNNPQLAYAQHILRNQHEYGTIRDTMTLLKPIHKTSMLIPYELHFVHTFQHNSNLNTEQSRGEQNPLFLLAIDTGLTSQLFHNR